MINVDVRGNEVRKDGEYKLTISEEASLLSHCSKSTSGDSIIIIIIIINYIIITITIIIDNFSLISFFRLSFVFLSFISQNIYSPCMV